MAGIAEASVAIGYFGLASDLVSFIFSRSAKYRDARFGLLGNVYYWLYLLDTNEVQRRHWDINFWKDEECMNWKSTYTSSCNSISVAGAIFASIGLTSLQLPYMDQTHWTARTLLTMSMVLGIFSVTFAVTLQQQVSQLNSALDVRLWLSRGKPDPGSARKYEPPFGGLPLESSVSALKLSRFPATLLNVAVLLYLVGFGIYLLFCWLNTVEPGDSTYRNVFIVYVAGASVISIYYIAFSIGRVLDDKKRSDEFRLVKVKAFEDLLQSSARLFKRELGPMYPSLGTMLPQNGPQEELELVLTRLQMLQGHLGSELDQEQKGLVVRLLLDLIKNSDFLRRQARTFPGEPPSATAGHNQPRPATPESV